MAASPIGQNNPSNNDIYSASSSVGTQANSPSISAPSLNSAPRTSQVNDQIASTASDMQKYAQKLKSDVGVASISSDTARIQADYQTLSSLFSKLDDTPYKAELGQVNGSTESGFLQSVGQAIDAAQSTVSVTDPQDITGVTADKVNAANSLAQELSAISTTTQSDAASKANANNQSSGNNASGNDSFNLQAVPYDWNQMTNLYTQTGT